MILNCGCGFNKIRGAINIDIESCTAPDLICDFKRPLPFPNGSVDKIYFFHVIEHLTEPEQIDALMSFREVLKDDGCIYITYPEFVTCAKNFIENHRGMREFWKRTIYGRQIHPHDYHVSLMYTPSFSNLLEQIGFRDIETKPEKNESYNTVVKAFKGEQPRTKEEIYRKVMFPECHSQDSSINSESNKISTT